MIERDRRADMADIRERTEYRGRGWASTTRRLGLLSLSVPVLAIIGLIISGYLTYVHWQDLELICGELGDCEVVNTSVYSEVYGIPVALLGFFAYAALFALGLLHLHGGWRYSFIVPFASFSLSLAGVLYSAWLTYIELFVLRAICVWCVGSAVTISAIAAISATLLLRWAKLGEG